VDQGVTAFEFAYLQETSRTSRRCGGRRPYYL
jgi:hypothetical protein